ncbi:hypothetical protein BDV96DRAFT_499988 [Lophiotrema nucula]|uniref:DUF1479-domain-containing protein n=1 Tax=Lophiotrema nucula TaxID=690887 RepID=A0A6A5YYS3_9PLEO|nr:hypothetical protein BDV96DRAFT_499988 [Lophiotrema nucula]
MPGLVRQWPAWPEFGTTSAGNKDAKDPDFVGAKKAIIEEYGADSLRKSWIATCEKLRSVTDDIASQGSCIIPVLEAENVLANGFSEHELSQVRETGCFIVQGVIPHEEVKKLYQDLTQYVADNRSSIKGWPAETPSILRLYNSPTQNAIRTHPNQLRLQKILNDLWHDETGETSSDPLIYLDAVRDRPPHQPFLGLGPHIDAGSLCRWADPQYRKAYAQIFSGKPEAHDAWDLGARKNADQDLFHGGAHSTVLRSFQGWTALTRAAANEGTLLLVPNLPTTLAYMLLRPFFKPPQQEGDIMDASKWSLDDSGAFPGTMKPDSQRLSRSSHPHLRLEECLVHVPTMTAGDTIWWHTDVCHAVDPRHTGSENASVVYVPACPTTTINKRYVKKQLESTLAGRAPPDFGAGSGTDESRFKGYQGHDGINEDAKRALGYDL